MWNSLWCRESKSHPPLQSPSHIHIHPWSNPGARLLSSAMTCNIFPPSLSIDCLQGDRSGCLKPLVDTDLELRYSTKTQLSHQSQREVWNSVMCHPVQSTRLRQRKSEMAEAEMVRLSVCRPQWSIDEDFFAFVEGEEEEEEILSRENWLKIVSVTVRNNADWLKMKKK